MGIHFLLIKLYRKQRHLLCFHNTGNVSEFWDFQDFLRSSMFPELSSQGQCHSIGRVCVSGIMLAPACHNSSHNLDPAASCDEEEAKQAKVRGDTN